MDSTTFPFPTMTYRDAVTQWPSEGQHVLATYDDETIVVYQAYRPSIGRHAAEHGRFGNGFKFTRMSWIKPNFLWMMYRSGWGTKEEQEVTLALVLRRAFFDDLLARAVPSTFDAERYATEEDWKRAVGSSDVRLQWDPDHNPAGGSVARRAIQLGLRGPALAGWNGDDLLAVHDVSAFVAAQRPHAKPPYTQLQVPAERSYPA
ncbi:MAG: DUF4291 domain-containing protein [Planctomycetota bacterium]